MKYLKLSQGKYAIVDDADYDVVKDIKWYYHNAGYAATKYFSGKTMLLHRYLMQELSFDSEMLVDHVDGNKLDNRRSNLRICTHSQNMQNSKISKKNTSGHKGINAHKYGLWRARVIIDGKEICKYFKTKTEAVEARKLLVQQYHGEFARLA